MRGTISTKFYLNINDIYLCLVIPVENVFLKFNLLGAQIGQ